MFCIRTFFERSSIDVTCGGRSVREMKFYIQVCCRGQISCSFFFFFADCACCPQGGLREAGGGGGGVHALHQHLRLH